MSVCSTIIKVVSSFSVPSRSGPEDLVFHPAYVYNLDAGLFKLPPALILPNELLWLFHTNVHFPYSVFGRSGLQDTIHAW